MPTLICDCNQTMPLDPKALGRTLDENLTLHTTLCRREAPAFQQAVRGSGEVVVACTQEKRLFVELARETEGAVAPVRFVNIRETGGWSADARAAGPKIAALLAAARLPEPEPVPVVSYRSGGRLLVIGPLEAAEHWAGLAGEALQVTVLATGGSGAQERRYPVIAGRIERLSGWLGAFQLAVTRSNPIDLDLCTRCNACVAACPEGAIGLDYQIDLDTCRGHRACVKACDAAGAIDFQREPVTQDEAFDLVLDLREQPAFLRHALPQGYFHLPPAQAAGAAALQTLLQLRDLVGEFEKPRFVNYRQKLCAHSRNEQVGCNACVGICSAEAITSQKERQQIQVNASLCVGCGACTTVCPTGALSYAYPKAVELGTRIRTLLSTYAQAGGRAPMLLLHSQQRGQALVEELGRAARVGAAQGVPAQVIPLALWHTASLGPDVWLAAVAQGAVHVAVLTTAEEAPQYLEGLQAQMAMAQAVLQGLGYAGSHFSLLRASHPTELDQEMQLLRARVGAVPAEPARFALAPEKRTTLDLALDHLITHAPQRPDAIPLPAGAPFGAVQVNGDRCTLCMSCVGACPAGALRDNPQAPQLRFHEASCVQCGLCVKTCPEDALALLPRLVPGPARREVRVVAETKPYGCIRCGKPFGTQKAVEAMLGKLAGHAMFQGAALERLKMCADCRVIDIHSSTDEARITDA